MRKIRIPGADAAEIGDEDPLARLDSEFVMLTGSVHRLLDTLKKGLGGYEQQAPSGSPASAGAR